MLSVAVIEKRRVNDLRWRVSVENRVLDLDIEIVMRDGLSDDVVEGESDVVGEWDAET